MLKVANSVINASRITGVLPVVNGGTNASTASITSFNNITGFTASGTTGTTSTNLVFATTPTLVGDVNLSTGNLVIGTAGKGIDFSITSSGSGTMTSELLADYEEGTWTPNLVFGGLSTGITYNSRSGYYTKIGRQVTVYASFNLSSKGSATGSAVISDLPFTGNVNYYPCPIQFYNAASLTSSVHGAIITNAVYLYYTTSVGDSNITDANFNNNSEMYVVATYFV